MRGATPRGRAGCCTAAAPRLDQPGHRRHRQPLPPSPSLPALRRDKHRTPSHTRRRENNNEKCQHDFFILTANASRAQRSSPHVNAPRCARPHQKKKQRLNNKKKVRTRGRVRPCNHFYHSEDPNEKRKREQRHVGLTCYDLLRSRLFLGHRVPQSHLLPSLRLLDAAAPSNRPAAPRTAGGEERNDLNKSEEEGAKKKLITPPTRNKSSRAAKFLCESSQLHLASPLPVSGGEAFQRTCGGPECF